MKRLWKSMKSSRKQPKEERPLPYYHQPSLVYSHSSGHKSWAHDCCTNIRESLIDKETSNHRIKSLKECYIREWILITGERRFGDVYPMMFMWTTKSRTLYSPKFCSTFTKMETIFEEHEDDNEDPDFYSLYEIDASDHQAYYQISAHPWKIDACREGYSYYDAIPFYDPAVYMNPDHLINEIDIFRKERRPRLNSRRWTLVTILRGNHLEHEMSEEERKTLEYRLMPSTHMNFVRKTSNFLEVKNSYY